MEVALTKIKEYIDSHPELSEYVDLALKDVKPQIKEEVYRFLIISKVQPDDPLFKLMLACHYFNLVTLNAPNEIEKAFEVGTVNLLDKLAEQIGELKGACVKQVEADISRTVNRLLEKQGNSTPRQKWLNFGKYGLLTFIPLMMGIFLTNQYYQRQQLGTLELENRQLLSWARSKEGQFAKKLMNWNPGLFNGRCEQSVANLGIGFGEVIRKDGENVGMRETKNGYCVVWRKPPKF